MSSASDHLSIILNGPDQLCGGVSPLLCATNASATPTALSSIGRKTDAVSHPSFIAMISSPVPPNPMVAISSDFPICLTACPAPKPIVVETP